MNFLAPWTGSLKREEGAGHQNADAPPGAGHAVADVETNYGGLPSSASERLQFQTQLTQPSQQQPKVSKPALLDAWADPVAGISAYTPCVHTCNLFGDGEWRLIVGDEGRKLKVWSGTHKEPEHNLLDSPVALASFYAEANAKLPSLAVAAGAHVYIYRNLRPYYKFVLPPEDVNEAEQECWAKLLAGELVVGDAVHELARLQDDGVMLTGRSLQIMNIADPEKKLSFVEQCQGQPLVAVSVITCMAVLNLVLDEPGAASCLVLGTESGRILILNPTGNAIIRNIWVGVAPALLAVNGQLETNYCITVAGRDGKLYNIKNGSVQQSMIQMETPVVGMTRLGKSILVACMNDVVHSFQENGHKNYSIYMPAPVLTIQRMEVVPSTSKCLLVALANGEVRVYSGKSLVHKHTLPSVATAMWFGRYGREENTLITVTKSGALDIKVLPRTSSLNPSNAQQSDVPEQEIPLQVPKKTRLYLEQTKRETEQASDMHRIFQRDLAKLKLTAARTYVKLLTDGKGALASTPSANLSLKLSAHGLGPRFRMLVTVRNDGATHVHDIPVVLSAPEKMYKLDQKLFTVPLLVPRLSYTFEVGVMCLDPEGGSEIITVVMLSKSNSTPILQAQLRMPASELEDD